MKPRLLSLAALCLASGFPLLAPGSRAAAPGPNYALIEKLPERETAAKKTLHGGFADAAPGKALAATNAYNDALAGMVAELAAAYYVPAKITKDEVAAYVKSLKAAAEFRHRLDNPAGEDRGGLDPVEAPAAVSGDLEENIAQMVEAVTGDDEKFDFAAWQKRWADAVRFGDEEADQPAASPAPAPAASPAATPEAAKPAAAKPR